MSYASDYEASSFSGENQPSRRFTQLPSTQGPELQPGCHDFKDRFLSLFLRSSSIDILIRCSPDLESFLTSELEPATSVLDLVILTGSLTCPWATTCGEYISAAWPEFSDAIKKVVQWLRGPRLSDDQGISPGSTCVLSSDLGMNSTVEQVPLRNQPTSLTNAGVTFLMIGDKGQCALILEVVAWLCSALRTTSTNGIEESRSILENVVEGTEHMFQIINQPTALKADGLGSCWTLLVPKFVTAKFPVPFRPNQMYGMETSFELLCFLCGLEYEVVDEGGVVLYGERSIVYPIRNEGDGVQWHFEPRDLLSEGCKAMNGQESRLIIDDLRILWTAKRHFLGLWADSRITLGTELLDSSNIRWSTLPEMKKERMADGIFVGGSITIPRFLNLTVTKSYKIAKSRKSIYLANFEAKMQSLINVPTILFCVSDLRSWMVPFVSVVLHLARARADHQKDLGLDIPPCELEPDGGQAAFNIIQRYCQNSFRDYWKQADERLKEQATVIENYISEVWAALDCVSRETHKAKRYFRMQMCGYEMADLARLKPRLRMKRHRLEVHSAGWTPLLDEVPLALFYEGLSEPIIPWPSNGSKMRVLEALGRISLKDTAC